MRGFNKHNPLEFTTCFVYIGPSPSRDIEILLESSVRFNILFHG